MAKQFDVAAIGTGAGASAEASRCRRMAGRDRRFPTVRGHLRAARVRSEKGAGRRRGSDRLGSPDERKWNSVRTTFD